MTAIDLCKMSACTDMSFEPPGDIVGRRVLRHVLTRRETCLEDASWGGLEDMSSGDIPN